MYTESGADHAVLILCAFCCKVCVDRSVFDSFFVYLLVFYVLAVCCLLVSVLSAHLREHLE